MYELVVWFWGIYGDLGIFVEIYYIFFREGIRLGEYYFCLLKGRIKGLYFGNL